MNKFVNKNRKSILIFIDCITIIISLIIAFLLRFDFSIPSIYLNKILYLIPFLIIFQISIFNFSGYYNLIWRFTSLGDMINIIKGVTLSNLITFSLVGLIEKTIRYPRSVLLMFFISD